MTVECVPVSKLLGVTINSALKWGDHVTAIISTASKRLWFLKKLKHAGVSVSDRVHNYKAVIRPVLKYACVIWHSSSDRTQQLEKVQRRELQIFVGDIYYDSSCCTYELSSLSDRRREQCGSLFKQIVSCLALFASNKERLSPRSQTSICSNITVISCADNSCKKLVYYWPAYT